MRQLGDSYSIEIVSKLQTKEVILTSRRAEWQIKI